MASLKLSHQNSNANANEVEGNDLAEALRCINDADAVLAEVELELAPVADLVEA